MTNTLPCPCCGYLTLSERGVYDICEVCFWEDDGQDDPQADEDRGGPNGVRLTKARRNYLREGVAEPKDQEHVRPPQRDEPQHRWFSEADESIVESVRIEVLPGLPPYGVLPARFSPEAWNDYEEGFVVRFTTLGGNSWTGNFRGGWGGAAAVHRHPDGLHAVVVASGVGYIVDPKTAEVSEFVGHTTTAVIPCPAAAALALCGDTDLIVLYANGDIWRPARISWDGIANLRMDASVLLGNAYDPMNDAWTPFAADLVERRVTGGSYPTELTPG